ncbi:MAG: pantoate--beta-alanine ligase [Candidatus Omnitrophota bacterium]
MEIIRNIDHMRTFSLNAKRKGKTIGFVPTMGYLHEGHLSLVRAAREECDVVCVSIFVNPIQFGKNEDLDKYPRDTERDKDLLEKEDINVLFIPGEKDMYPENFCTYVETTGRISQIMCAASRPGHFKGVTTVVAKLFNMIAPDRSYFGQKDIQQAAIIKKMTEDLQFAVEIKILPTVRENDGLAMSSRNVYLSPEERQQALSIYEGLKKAEEKIMRGEVSPNVIKNVIKAVLEKNKDMKTDYVEIVSAEDLSPVDTIKGKTLIAVAAFVGKTRLIDNIIVNGK